MISLSFLNTALLWGLGLASIPLIIHLLFRRRFRELEWAPMKYLKLTIQRNRRRIQIEQLLLLLLRTALIIVLVCLVARPVMNASGLSRWFGGETRTSHLLVIDDSLSMGLSKNGRTAFDRALAVAEQAIEELGLKDRLTLVVTSRTHAPLVREIELTDRGPLLGQLRSLKPTETHTAWSATLSAVDEFLQSTTFPTQVVTILTDLRRSGWETVVAPPEGWKRDRLSVRIVDVGATSEKNLSLESLQQADRLALVGTPLRFEATLVNRSSSNVDAAEATWIIDGQPTQVTLPALAAGESVVFPLTAVFNEAGPHAVSLRLPSDDLAGDNQRWSMVDVRDNLRILLVDGEPASEPFQSETDYLGLALSLAIGESKAFQVETAMDNEWVGQVRGSAPDMIVFANVANFDAQQAATLKAMVERGMGVVFYPGDLVDPENYERNLFNAGQGVLPWALDTTADDQVAGLLLEDNAPSAVDAVRQLNPAVLGRIKVNKRYLLKNPDEVRDQTRVLARWNDATASPALVEKTLGKGRVLLWTVAADKAWSDWPTEPSYVLTMRETVKATIRADLAVRTSTAGEPLRAALGRDRRITAPTIELPLGEEPRPLVLEVASATDGETPLQRLTWSDTQHAGLYRMHWQEVPSGPVSETYAVNPDQRESDLAALTPEELRERWREVRPEIIRAFANADLSVGIRGQELWRTFACCLLGMLAVESVFAVFVGRQR